MLSAEMKRKKMNKYWAKRKLDESQAFQKTSETKLLKKLAREYRRMAEEVSNELESEDMEARGATSQQTVFHSD